MRGRTRQESAVIEKRAGTKRSNKLGAKPGRFRTGIAGSFPATRRFKPQKRLSQRV